MKLKTGFSEFELAHDPVENAWFEWDLDVQVARLSSELASGTYRCSPPMIVRESKSLGLTRPLAYLSLRDQLVFKSIVVRAENEMLKHAQPWTRFGRADHGEQDIALGRDSGWFRGWLERQSQLWVITAGHPFLVETDIANFFPTVPVQHLMDHVRATSRLSDEVVRLLEHILRSTAPTTKYRTSASVGLPQENHDCSRVLAHSYLLPVDTEFLAEGVTQSYSRWMDDIVVGADSERDGFAKVQRIQLALEPIGLYPNTAKTRIVTAAQFLREYMKSENDFLGEVDDKRKAGAFGAAERAAFGARMRKFLKQPRGAKGWERVLRRYYTACRYLDESALKTHAERHMAEWPGSIPNVLEYLRGYQVSTSTVSLLARLHAATEEFYEDVPLLIQEFLVSSPNSNRPGVRTSISTFALSVASANSSKNRRLAAAAALTAAKFGETTEVATLVSMLRADVGPDDTFRRQLAVVAFGLGNMDTATIGALGGWNSGESVMTLRFLRATESGEQRAVQIVLGLAKPERRGVPLRPMVRSRVALLVPAIRRSAPQAVANMGSSWTLAMRNCRPRHRDAASERLLGV